MQAVLSDLEECLKLSVVILGRNFEIIECYQFVDVERCLAHRIMFINKFNILAEVGLGGVENILSI